MPKPAVLKIVRRPLALRVYLGIFALVWCSVLSAGLVTAVIQESPGAALILLMLAYGVVVFHSEQRVSVEIRTDSLLIRNRVRTHEIARADIEDLRIGPTGWDPFRESVHLRTRDGQEVELVVTRRADLLRGRRIALEKLLDELTTWRLEPLESESPDVG